jgi:hypothetical protein
MPQPDQHVAVALAQQLPHLPAHLVPGDAVLGFGVVRIADHFAERPRSLTGDSSSDAVTRGAARSAPTFEAPNPLCSATASAEARRIGAWIKRLVEACSMVTRVHARRPGLAPQLAICSARERQPVRVSNHGDMSGSVKSTNATTGAMHAGGCTPRRP